MKPKLALVMIVAVVTLAIFAVLAVTVFDGKAKTVSGQSATTVYDGLVLSKDIDNPQTYVNNITNAILYVMDSRTKLCFAFISGVFVMGGGPALATVPCEAIPPELLLIGEKK